MVLVPFIDPGTFLHFEHFAHSTQFIPSFSFSFSLSLSFSFSPSLSLSLPSLSLSLSLSLSFSSLPSFPSFPENAPFVDKFWGPKLGRGPFLIPKKLFLLNFPKLFSSLSFTELSSSLLSFVSLVLFSSGSSLFLSFSIVLSPLPLYPPLLEWNRPLPRPLPRPYILSPVRSVYTSVLSISTFSGVSLQCKILWCSAVKGSVTLCDVLWYRGKR